MSSRDALPPPVDMNHSPTSSTTLADELEHRDGVAPLKAVPLSDRDLEYGHGKAVAVVSDPSSATTTRQPPANGRQRGFSDLRQPVRGITAPATTGRMLRALSGDYNADELADLRQRRFNSGLFILVDRDDLREIGREKSTAEKGEQKDPNVITFDGDDDPLNSQNWSTRAKIGQTVLLGITTLVVTFASSVFSRCGRVSSVAHFAQCGRQRDLGRGEAVWRQHRRGNARDVSIRARLFVLVLDRMPYRADSA
jgi:hypothetical protein